uniref:Uncharacterized protein n=1 Tax=Trichobilharzia regenti TaxID=157069 RepID=A0AA85J4W6_TRIRE|nr:unnamed protein product [Trichobilharzia regenti]CAH8821009.1 unnamed protein product [Trichobilharzia regenti]
MRTPFFGATSGRSRHYNLLSPQHALRWLKNGHKSDRLRYHGFGAQWYASISLRVNNVSAYNTKFLLP